MSFEYSSALPVGSTISLPSLVSFLKRIGLVPIALPTAEAISLRSLENPYRPDWPEDVSILLEPGIIFVTIHAGTAKQRQQILSEVNIYVARELGFPIALKEV